MEAVKCKFQYLNVLSSVENRKRRIHPMEDQYAYTEDEFFEFARTIVKDEEQAIIMGKKLWTESAGVLEDEECTSWSEIKERNDEHTLIAVVAARRFVASHLKEHVRNEGMVATFGQPGSKDAMDGLRSTEQETWIVPWLAKTVGAVVAASSLLRKFKIVLVFLKGEIGTGSQAEWACRHDLARRIKLESTYPMDVCFLVAEPEEVCSSYGLDYGGLESDYYKDEKVIYFVRHGQSEGNITDEEVSNPRLTVKGISQAASWRSTVADFKAAKVIVSPHLRTLQTAVEMKLLLDDMVIASCAGELAWDEKQNQRVSEDELQKFRVELGLLSVPIVYKDFENEDESIALLKDFINNYDASTLVVVTHCRVIKAMTGWTLHNGQIVKCWWERGVNSLQERKNTDDDDSAEE